MGGASEGASGGAAGGSHLQWMREEERLRARKAAGGRAAGGGGGGAGLSPAGPWTGRSCLPRASVPLPSSPHLSAARSAMEAPAAGDELGTTPEPTVVQPAAAPPPPYPARDSLQGEQLHLGESAQFSEELEDRGEPLARALSPPPSASRPLARAPLASAARRPAEVAAPSQPSPPRPRATRLLPAPPHSHTHYTPHPSLLSFTGTAKHLPSPPPPHTHFFCWFYSALSLSCHLRGPLTSPPLCIL